MHLSIILPYFKKKNTVKQTLNSIINQSLKNMSSLLFTIRLINQIFHYNKEFLKIELNIKIIENKYILELVYLGTIPKSKSKYTAFVMQMVVG